MVFSSIAFTTIIVSIAVFFFFNLLLVTLAVTPVRQITGWRNLIRLRRMLGLFAFFYALAHFTVYLSLDQVFDLRAVGADILKRPYITIDMLALPIAVERGFFE